MKRTYLFAGITIFLWSTVATTCKILLTELNNMQLLWMNSLIAAVFLFLVNLISGNFKKFKQYTVKDYCIMALIGLPGTLLYYLFYYAGTDLLPASQAFIVNYLWPIMSVVFACIVLKERLTVRKVIAIFMSFIGVIIVMGRSVSALDSSIILGALCCILGAVSYGVFTAFNQKMNYNKSLSLMTSYFVTFLITTIIILFNGGIFMARGDQMLGFLWNGILAVAVANVLWVRALESGKTAKISNLAYITPFISLIWTFLFLHEPITINSLLGLVVIVAGIFIQLNDKETKEAEVDKAV